MTAGVRICNPFQGDAIVCLSLCISSSQHVCKRISGSSRRTMSRAPCHTIKTRPIQHHAHPSIVGCGAMLPGSALLEQTKPTVVAPPSASVMSSPTSRVLQPAAATFVPPAPLSGTTGASGGADVALWRVLHSLAPCIREAVQTQRNVII